MLKETETIIMIHRSHLEKQARIEQGRQVMARRLRAKILMCRSHLLPIQGYQHRTQGLMLRRAKLIGNS